MVRVLFFFTLFSVLAFLLRYHWVLSDHGVVTIFAEFVVSVTILAIVLFLGLYFLFLVSGVYAGVGRYLHNLVLSLALPLCVISYDREFLYQDGLALFFYVCFVLMFTLFGGVFASWMVGSMSESAKAKGDVFPKALPKDFLDLLPIYFVAGVFAAVPVLVKLHWSLMMGGK